MFTRFISRGARRYKDARIASLEEISMKSDVTDINRRGVHGQIKINRSSSYLCCLFMGAHEVVYILFALF
jgi:hypothetical protein